MRLLLALLLLPSLGYGRVVTLAWDPNPDPDIAGYRLHWGPEPGRYPNSVNVGNVTSSTILIPNEDTYAVVTAYNAAGLESPPSNEVYIGKQYHQWIREYNNNLDFDGDGEPDGLQYVLYASADPDDHPDLDLDDPDTLIIWEYSRDLETWTEGSRGPANRPLTMIRPKQDREFFRHRIVTL